MDERTNVYEQTSGACRENGKGCQRTECRFHMSEPYETRGRRLVRLPVLRWSCLLDAADEGPHSLETIGNAIGVVRERVRRIEAKALIKIGRELKRRGWPAEDVRELLAMRETASAT